MSSCRTGLALHVMHLHHDLEIDVDDFESSSPDDMSSSMEGNLLYFCDSNVSFKGVARGQGARAFLSILRAHFILDNDVWSAYVQY